MRVKFVLLLILPAFFAIAVALHHPGFHAPMVYDSVGFIQEYEYLFASHHLAAVIGIVPARPLLMVTLYANYLLTGMDPYVFRLFNAFILACTSTVLALLSILVLELPGLNLPGTRLEKRVIGTCIGLLFLVHPLQELVVLYIWQREAILACFFVFSAMGVYMAGRSGKWIRPVPANMATALLFLAGILSKENVITLPVVLVLAEILLLRGADRCPIDPPSLHRDAHAIHRSSRGFPEIVRRTLVIAAITVPPFLVSLWVAHTFHDPESAYPQGVVNRLVQYYRSAGITPVEVALTECRVVFWYLFTIVAPFRSGVEIIAPCVVSRSLWSPPITMAAVAGVGALTTLGIALARRHPVPSFGILFFLITLAPESLLIPQYLFCGYRAILPMAGLLLVFGALMLGWFSRNVTDHRDEITSGSHYGGGLPKNGNSGPRIAALGLLLGMTIGLALMTLFQAEKWKPFTIWKNAYDALPPFTKDVETTPYLDILGNYGLQLKDSGDYAAAVHVLDQAIRIDSPPNNFKKTLALANKGLALIKKGDKPQGLDALKEAARIDPNDAWACFQLAEALLDQGHKEAGLETLKKAVELNPRYLPSRMRLGLLLRESGRFEDAVRLFQQAAKQNPYSGAIQTALGASQEQAGTLESALRSYQNAVRLEPLSADYHFNLAKCLMKMGNMPDAIKNYQRAVELKPSFGPAYANLGTLLLRSGRMREAVSSFEKAMAILPHHAELRFQAATALLALHRGDEAKVHLEKALAMNPNHTQARQALDRLTLTDDMPSEKHR